MTAAPGPSGILAGRPSGCQSQLQNGTATKASNNKKVAVLESGRCREKEDLVTRTSVIDAKVAIQQIKRGRAQGALWKMKCRDSWQRKLYELGRREYSNVPIYCITAIVMLAICSFGLKSSKMQHKVEELWISMDGKLEQEIINTTRLLGEASMTTHQLLIQNPRFPGENVLKAKILLEHFEVLKAAIKVSVEVDSIVWTLWDLCYKAPPPFVEDYLAEKIFDGLIPCSIITPLDCFWEGSKLLGPNNVISVGIKNLPIPPWSRLDPLTFLGRIEQEYTLYNFDEVKKFMETAGVTTGYQYKPCLNPMDPLCPETAPNFFSKLEPDVGSELTDGCHSFAANLLHWPQELIVGGTMVNRSGQIIYAAALQTVVQLMSEKELEEFHKDRPELKYMSEKWNKTKAGVVLKAWQNAFKEKVQEIRANMDSNFNAFSTITLNDILEKYTELSFLNVAIGRTIILIYVSVVLYNQKNAVHSQTTVGVAGVLLAFIAEFPGVGLCAITQTPFNVVITQTLPFVNAVLTISDIFMLIHSYSELSMTDNHGKEKLGIIMKRVGPQIFLTRLCTSAAFFSCWLIPIPALRAFAQHAGMLNLIGIVVTFLIFPLFICFDLKRRSMKRYDVLCCCVAEIESAVPVHSSTSCNNNNAQPAVTRVMSPDRVETRTQVLTNQDEENEFWSKDNVNEDTEDYTEEDTLTGCSQDDCLGFSLTHWVKNHYAPFIIKRWIRMIALSAFGIIVVVCVWQAMKVKDGLELTDIVPKDSDEHAFLSSQSKDFGFYNMFAVTEDLNYPAMQDELHEYYKKLSEVKNVINTDTNQPTFWLILFTNWLKHLQATFDKEKAQGKLNTESWSANASSDAILAYKLIVQTGDPQDPIDKRRVDYGKLVSGDRINEKAFYFYLSAWVGNDALSYEISLANIRPKPHPWIFTKDTELKIPKSGNIKYAQIPFNLHKLTDTEKIAEMIFSVRQICDYFTTKLGMPNYPWGIPFLFWDQYMHLRTHLAYALGATGLSIIVIISILLMNIRAVVLILFYLAGIVLQLFGIMGFFNIHLSAVSAVMLVVSVGISVPYSVHFCLNFITSIGSRDRRAKLALENTFAPVLHGGVITLLSVLMMNFSNFDFVVRYFFFILFSAIIVALTNGLFFFPILLSLIGPEAELIPNANPDRISTPTPPSSPAVRRLKAPSISRRPHKSERIYIEPSPSNSLSTITEEPSSWQSNQESCNIIVQPEVKVETTSTTCGNQNCGGSDQNGSSKTSASLPMSHITTKITATANIKVELHTNGMDRRDKYRHGSSGRRSTRVSTNVNSTESSNSNFEQDSDANTKKN